MGYEVFSIASWWNDRLHLRIGHSCTDSITIISFLPYHMFKSLLCRACITYEGKAEHVMACSPSECERDPDRLL